MIVNINILVLLIYEQANFFASQKSGSLAKALIASTEFLI